MHHTALYYVQVEIDLVAKFMLVSAAMTQSSFAWQSFIPSGPFAIFVLIEHLKIFFKQFKNISKIFLILRWCTSAVPKRSKPAVAIKNAILLMA